MMAGLLHAQILCGCGCGMAIAPGELEREHDPALELRAYDEATRTYDPPANDPRYIKLWRQECHQKKTHGPGAERRVTTKGSDNHTARRIARLQAKQERHLAAMRSKGMPEEPDQKGGDTMAKTAAAKKGAKKPAKKPAKSKK